MAETASPTKPFWNPAFVGAAGLIFILLTALVGFAVSYTQVKSDGEALRRELKDTKDDLREVKSQLADEKDYTRDAIDQISRELNMPSPKPKKRGN